MKNNSSNGTFAYEWPSRGKTIITIGFIIILWFLLHFFSISWGLPGLSSLAPDTIPANTSYTASKAMLAGGNKYPYLQYLINSIFLPIHSEKGKSIEEIVELRTDRIIRMNWVTACMQLISAILIAMMTSMILKSLLGGAIASSLFLLNNVCLFYSTTSNMDIPYSMWILLSSVFLIFAQSHIHNKRKFIWFNILFAVCMSFAFCTKDQAYASYIIPLFILIIWQYFKFRKISYIIIECALWVIVLFVCVSVLYMAAGGVHLFLSHMQWIMNEGVNEYKQVPWSIYGQLKLITVSIHDILQLLDYHGMILIMILITFLVLKYKKSKDSSEEKLKFGRPSKVILFTCLVTYISILIFFIGIIQYSYVRFYLPLLPFYCYFIAWSYVNLKSSLSMRCIYLIFFAYQLLLSIQFIFELQYNSSTMLKNYNKTEIMYSEKFTVCDGVRVGMLNDFNNNKQYITLRDWSNNIYGYLSNCKSISINPLSIYLLAPDIVISDKIDDERLIEHGYGNIKTIKGFNSYLPSMYHFELPAFYVYQNINPNNCIIHEKAIAFISKEKFELIMIQISFIISPDMLQNKIKLLGKLLPEFQSPDLDRYHINPYAFAVFIEAYEQRNRVEDLSKIYNFLLKSRYSMIFEEPSTQFF